MPREKSRYRNRRSSSYSSDSSHEKKKSKSKHRRRSRSRDRSESLSQRRKRSVSRTRHKRRSYSRSVSRDRYKSSRSHSKRSKRSVSRDGSVSRSNSLSRSKHSKSSKKSRRRSLSSSSHSNNSFDIEKPLPQHKVNFNDTETKVEKAIKAAEAVGLTMTKIPTYEYKEVEIKEDMPSIHDRNTIAELNNDSFVPKSFTSSRSKKQQNIVIDLNTETVKVPKADVKLDSDDTILNLDALQSEEELKELWVKKLYLYRKKVLQDELQ